MIDSPQKNLGQGAEDPDFADARLVEDFYLHVKTWPAGSEDGAQLIVIDNSPPDLVADDVGVRCTRSDRMAPYGLVWSQTPSTSLAETFESASSSGRTTCAGLAH